MSTVSATHIGCSSSRNKGTCSNRRTIARAEIETRVLDALADRLMNAELFSIFCKEYVAETNRLRSAAKTSKMAQEAELANLKRDLDRLVQAIIDGASAASVKGRMMQLEARQQELEATLSNPRTPPPSLHPKMAELYRSRIGSLVAALQAPETRLEALRSSAG